MLLHIGDNVGLPLERVLFVLNARGMTARTRSCIEQAKKERRYTHCGATPKAYVVTQERGREHVYESAIASATLEKRWRDEVARRYLTETAVVSVDMAGIDEQLS